MYSPTAIDSAPPTRPATPASTTRCRLSLPPPTPSISDATLTRPSLAPSTPARSHGARCEKCSCSSGICAAAGQ